MQYNVLLAAIAGLASTGLALPVENTLLARANPPVGTPVACGTVPNNPTLKAKDVHVWERLDAQKVDYRDPDDKNVGFHKDLNTLQDVIGGSHYDVLFGTVTPELTFKYREVGLQLDPGWVKTHPSGKGGSFTFYNNPLTSPTAKREAEVEELAQRDLETRSDNKCYYRGIIAKGSAITSPTMAKTSATTHYKSKTYAVNDVDCVTTTNWIFSQLKF